VLVGGSYLVLRAQKETTTDSEAIKTTTLLSGQITALTSAHELTKSELVNVRQENGHLHELIDEKDKRLVKLQNDVEDLKQMILQRAEVDRVNRSVDRLLAHFNLTIEDKEPPLPFPPRRRATDE
jgi:predicted  nucleic acid-binding Zn-ribbon protein